MDIYDSRYFYINKRLSKVLGLWPYESRKENLCRRIVLMMSLITVTVPHVISFYKSYSTNVDSALENIFQIVYISGVAIKVVATINAEEKIKTVYESTAKDFQIIVERHERAILLDHSERGRLISLVFIVYVIFATYVYIAAPAIPMVLDFFLPLNESRPRIFISNGDFLVDKNEYYGQIFVFDAYTAVSTIFVVCAIDPMYAVIVEHSCALFAIITYRLKNCTKVGSKGIYSSKMNADEARHKYILEIIKLHTKIINFTRLLEMSYSTYFLMEMGMSILIISVTSVIILIRLGQAFECARFVLVFVGVLFHLFYLTWPGQKMIDHSSIVYRDTYFNEWYELSIKNQNLLKFMALRCVEACQLTAGGLYVMNFINFASVVQTSVSYITVFASFR